MTSPPTPIPGSTPEFGPHPPLPLTAGAPGVHSRGTSGVHSRGSSGDHSRGGKTPNTQQVDALLRRLSEAAPPEVGSSSSDTETERQNQLAVVRLGIASSLFFALRTKHAPTAAHGLRVAMTTSAWCERLGLPSTDRDRLEVAALLHNVGKIGVPDRILRKPGKLDQDERLTMDLTPRLSVEILRGCTGDTELLDVIRYRYQWFDSRRDDGGPRGAAIPLGSRMLAIAGAFDAMTTDTVYRPALSREVSLGELFTGAGSQFDPDLVDDFARMLEERPEWLQGTVANRWLHSLRDGGAYAWQEATTATTRQHAGHDEAPTQESEWLDHWLHQSSDGVVFVDTNGTILRYNQRMANLSGIEAGVAVGTTWNEYVSGLASRTQAEEKDASAESIGAVAGLLTACIQTGDDQVAELTLCRADLSDAPVEFHASVVRPNLHYNCGVMVIARDVSERAKLKRKLRTLHHKSTLDPLTKVANRAHFDDTLARLTNDAAKNRSTFSLIICDIDHFKKVNDTYGHQAGDEALIAFADVLKKHSREGDLVARYGGEEFLLLTVNCDNATATRRAEAIRENLERTPLPSLNHACVTASFGVTQFQAGDAPEIIVARADRALMRAKENGRNRVIQMGSGNKFEDAEKAQRSSWTEWLFGGPAEHFETDIITPVPIDLAIEKLRGFIADHQAEIFEVCESQVSMRLRVTVTEGGRRKTDHLVVLRVNLTLSERKVDSETGAARVKTLVHVILQPVRSWDRRARPLQLSFQQVNRSLRSYLMAETPAEER